MRRTPALIVGGGPAGAAAAITLARAGERPLLIERTRETGDALCGGFLSWRTLAALERLGLEPDAISPCPVTHVRLFAGEHCAQKRLPRRGLAVSRRRLDTLMLDRAERAGAAVERGIAARAVEDGSIRTSDGAKVATEALFLATGKHDLRGLARPVEAKGDDPAIGLRVRLGPGPAIERIVGRTVELHLLDRGYAGIAVQEDGTANCCMAIRRSLLDEAGGDVEALLARLATDHPRLAERLAERSSGSADAVANVPYGWRARAGVSGLFRLGDQAAVIPSLAGEGMGIAVASGIQAAHAFLEHGPAGSIRYQRRFARLVQRPMALAGTVRALVERPTGALLATALGRIPGLIQFIARATRVPHTAG